MAKKIQIDIEVNGKMQKVTVDAKKLRKELDGVDKSTDRVSKSTRDASRNMQGLSKRTSNSTKEFSKMQQGMGGIVGIYATIAAQVFAVSAAFQFLKDASDVSNLIAGQQALGAVTGVAYTSLTQSLRDATLGQLSFTEASRAAAIGTAGGLSPTQLEGLAKAAKNASIVLGRDLTDSFNRLVRGTTKAEPELLDELGIILRLDTALGKYASAIGVSVNELNAFQRTQAVANEVLGQAESKFGAIEDILDPSTASLNRFINSFDNLINTLKVELIGGLRPVFDFLSNNTAALVGALTLFALPIAKAILPNFKAWEEASKATLAAQEKKLTKLNKKIDKYSINIKKLKRSEEELLAATAERVKAADKSVGGVRSGGTDASAMGFLTSTAGKEANRRGEAEAKRLLDRAEAELERSTSQRTTILKKMSREQIADLREAQVLRSEILDEQTVAHQRQADAERLEEKKRDKEIKARGERTKGKMIRLGSSIARGFNMALFATGILGFLSLIISFGQEVFKALNPVSEEVEAINGKVDDLTSKLDNLTQDLSRTGDAFQSPDISLADKMQQLGNVANSTELLSLIQQLKVLKAEAGGAGVSTKELSGKFRTMLKELGRTSPTLANLAKGFLQAERGNKAAAKALEDYVILLKTGAQAARDFPATQAKIREEFNKLADAIKPITPLDTLFDLTSQAVSQATSELVLMNETISQQKQLLDEAIRKKNELDDRKPPSQPLAARKFRRDGPTQKDTDAAQLAVKNAEQNLEDAMDQGLDLNERVSETLSLQGAVSKAYEDNVGTIETANGLIREANASITAGLTLEERRANITAKQVKSEQKVAVQRAKLQMAIDAENLLRGQGLLTSSAELQGALALRQAEEDKLAEMEAQNRVLQTRTNIEELLLDGEDLKETIKFQSSLNSAKSFFNDLLRQEVKLLEQSIDLQADLARDAINLRAREAKVRNPFFDDQQFIAKEELRVAKQVKREKAPILEKELAAKEAMINMEFEMLQLKRQGLAIEMRALAINAAVADKQDLAAEAIALAGELESDASKKRIEDLRDSALKVAGMEVTAKGIRLDNAVRDAQALVDELKPINQVLSTGAEAFRDGLGDAVGATFDAITGRISSLKDALAGIAQDVLQQIQDAYIEQVLVRPIIEKLGGQQDVDPVDAAEIIQNKTIEAHKTGSGATKAAIEEGGELAGNKIKEKFEEAADNMSTKLANACKCEAPTAAEKRESSLLPEEPSVELVKEKKTAAEIAAENPLSSEGIDAMINDIAGMKTEEGKDAPKRGLFTGLGEKFSKFTTDFSAIFDKNTEGGFLTKLSTAFQSGGDIFSQLFGNLSGMFGQLFDGLGGLFGGGGGFSIGSLFGLPFEKGGLVQDKVAAYSSGGVARGPQSGYPAVLHGNEAVVPLPDGKSIPVSMQGMPGAGATQNNVTVNVTIDNEGNAQSSTSADSDQASNLGNLVAVAVQKELQNQKRSGGILSPHGVA